MGERFRGAAFHGNLPAVQRILQQPGGLNVNAADVDDFTALHHAVWRGYLAIVQTILQVEGVNVNARTLWGFTPLHLACSTNDTPLSIVQALLEAGADPNTAAPLNGETPLFHIFVRHSGQIHLAEALLDGGADPAARNSDRDTPLHRACCYRWRQLDVAQLLIQRQGSECLTLTNNLGQTPMDVLQINPLEKKEAAASIGKYILRAYAGVLAQRDGLLCLHSLLQDAAFTDVAEDGNDVEFELSVGKLNTEHLQMLLEFMVAAEPGSVRTLDRDGLLPLQVASLRNIPDLALYVLLRPFPDALL